VVSEKTSGSQAWKGKRSVWVFYQHDAVIITLESLEGGGRRCKEVLDAKVNTSHFAFMDGHS
jgi:hypothetical protein